jgi:hypothetical protein
LAIAQSRHNAQQQKVFLVIAAAIMTKLQTAIAQMEALTALLEGEEETEASAELLD